MDLATVAEPRIRHPNGSQGDAARINDHPVGRSVLVEWSPIGNLIRRFLNGLTADRHATEAGATNRRVGACVRIVFAHDIRLVGYSIVVLSHRGRKAGAAAEQVEIHHVGSGRGVGNRVAERDDVRLADISNAIAVEISRVGRNGRGQGSQRVCPRVRDGHLGEGIDQVQREGVDAKRFLPDSMPVARSSDIPAGSIPEASA